MRNIRSILKACALFVMTGYFSPLLRMGELSLDVRMQNNFVYVTAAQYNRHKIFTFSLNQDGGVDVSKQQKYSTHGIYQAKRISADDTPIIFHLLRACKDDTLPDFHPVIKEGLQKLVKDLSIKISLMKMGMSPIFRPGTTEHNLSQYFLYQEKMYQEFLAHVARTFKLEGQQVAPLAIEDAPLS